MGFHGKYRGGEVQASVWLWIMHEVWVRGMRIIPNFYSSR